MKHGRRHKTLKEQTYAARFHQGAEGYAREYSAIDVAEPENPVVLPDEVESSLASRLSTRDKKRLRFRGVDPDAEDPREERS